MAKVKVEQLFYYPVKSLRGVSLTSMTLDDFGPAGDRRWMLVDPEGCFVTQREQPRLALIQADLHDGRLVLTLPGEADPVAVEPSDTEQRVRVWRDWVKARFAAGDASERLSRWLDTPVSLVYMPDSSLRPVDHNYSLAERRVSFADGFPFLVTHTASLQALSARAGQDFDMRRFRPNIVVSGGDAFAEDQWRALTIDGLRLDLVKPCSRCVMTTVDPDKGEKAADLQPLRELGRFRRTPDGVMFGVNGIHSGTGGIRVGDWFDVELKEEH
ncbi:MOSC domain-containing protein [Marinobacter sp. JSM 1782161]|uniref:MOSC domain-containing protein n=1 Tax=Marinobacter sp. JSM 1782161 TaxID=2685906 RepID=UPI0014033022|nr:MOSC N-terminal beta barrel domain-containing protein [Marinobacter sp. JSM 1782161]